MIAIHGFSSRISLTIRSTTKQKLTIIIIPIETIFYQNPFTKLLMKIRYLCICPSRIICGAANTLSTYPTRALRNCNKNIPSLKPTSTKRKQITSCTNYVKTKEYKNVNLPRAPDCVFCNRCSSARGNASNFFIACFIPIFFYFYNTNLSAA